MLIEAPHSQLVLIDLQTKLVPAMHDGAGAVANAVRLAQAAQWLRVPVCMTEQYPQGLGPTVPPAGSLGAAAFAKTKLQRL